MWSYEPFWKTLEKKPITQYELINQYHINAATLQRIRNGGSITMKTLQKLCFALDCTPNDIVVFMKNESEN